ncbi:MAG: phage portal protein [Planctomycetota bacterium]
MPTVTQQHETDEQLAARVKRRFLQNDELAAMLDERKLLNRLAEPESSTRIGRGHGGGSGYFGGGLRAGLNAGPPGRGGSARSFRTESERHRIGDDCTRLLQTSTAAQAASQTMVGLTLGDGPEITSACSDPGYAALATEHLEQWAESTEFDHFNLCTMRESLSGGIGQELAARGRFAWLKTNTGRIELIEDQRIRNPNGVMDGGRFAGGLEWAEGTEKEYLERYGVDTGDPYPDGRRRLRRVHVAQWHRGQHSATTDTTAYPARYIELFNNPLDAAPNSPGKIGFLAPAKHRFDEIDLAKEATTAAYVIATFFSVLIEGPGSKGKIEDLVARNRDVASAFADGEISLSPGMIEALLPGQRATQLKPEHPTTAADAWIDSQHIDAFSAMGLSRGVVQTRFDRNFHASKSEVVLVWRKTIIPMQRMLRRPIENVCRWRIRWAVEQGLLGPPTCDDYDAVSVTLGSMPVLDPAQELKSLLEANRAGVMTRDTISKRLSGRSFGTVVREVAEEEQLMRELGLVRPENEPNMNGARPDAVDGQDSIADDEPGGLKTGEALR